MRGARPKPRPARPSIYARLVGALPWKMDFEKSGIRLSVLMPLVLGAMVGVLAAIMGVGGGFIMVPVMVYLLRMPMHVVVGTSLFQILFTCTNVTVMQAWMNHTVDFVLALLLLFGSVLGAQIGVRISRRLKAEQLKILMSVIVLLVMVKMLGRPADRAGYHAVLPRRSLMLRRLASPRRFCCARAWRATRASPGPPAPSEPRGGRARQRRRSASSTRGQDVRVTASMAGQRRRGRCA